MNEFGGPNPALHSDPACIAFRSLSTSCYLDFVERLGAGGAGELLPLGAFGLFQCVAVLWSSYSNHGFGFELSPNRVGANFTALRPMATLSSWCWHPSALPRSFRTNSGSFPFGSSAWFFVPTHSLHQSSASVARVGSNVLARLTSRCSGPRRKRLVR